LLSQNHQLNLWVAKSSLFPFEVNSAINNKCICMAVLPVLTNYLAIKDLFQKMLAVLDLSEDQLAIVNFYYSDNNNLNYLANTKKILAYYKQIKLILQFGDLELFDLNYLNLQKIIIVKTFHPEYLLKHPESKKQAYQDLLQCKSQILTLL
jgi:hypothetical protein